MFSTQTIAALVVGAALGVIIPVIAVIVYKKKNRDTWLPSAFIGAATFILFALILESLLHQVMLPIVQGNLWLYGIYGALAAGVFEETGRLVAYKTLMRKHYTTKNSIMMGLGHGGIEAVIILSYTLTLYAVMMILSNSMGLAEALEFASKGNAESAAQLGAMLESVKGYNFATCALGVVERVIAMTFHTCMSVWVYKAVSQKGKIWLYPAAILAHAGLDFFAVLNQVGIITSTLLLYVILIVFAAATVSVTVIMAKKLPDNAR